MMQTERVAFANALRGVAALCVVVFHYAYLFPLKPHDISELIGAPPLPRSPNAFTDVLEMLPPSFLGRFGVALFFLISGFVIPFSLAQQGRRAFAIGRFFRIWPTYAVGFVVSLAAIWLCSRWYAAPIHFQLSHCLANLALVRDLFWWPAIDGVVWTLEIEARFYILAIVLAGALRAAHLRPVLIAAVIVSGMGYAAGEWLAYAPDAGERWLPLNTTPQTTQMITFMLVGTMFNFHFRGAIGNASLIGAAAALFALAGAAWDSADRIGAGGALAAFAVAYALRDAFSWRHPLLDWLAARSFPLYVVHGALGYAVIHVLVGIGTPLLIATGAALAAALSVAALLHALVELPSQRVGKRGLRARPARDRWSAPCGTALKPSQREDYYERPASPLIAGSAKGTEKASELLAS